MGLPDATYLLGYKACPTSSVLGPRYKGRACIIALLPDPPPSRFMLCGEGGVELGADLIAIVCAGVRVRVLCELADQGHPLQPLLLLGPPQLEVRLPGELRDVLCVCCVGVSVLLEERQLASLCLVCAPLSFESDG